MFSTANYLRFCESQYQFVPGNISEHTASNEEHNVSNIWINMKAAHSTKMLKHCS
jgi:hypothetical protein